MRISILLFAFLAACSHGEKKQDERPEQRTEKIPVSLNPAPDAGASMETKQVAAQSAAPFSTEIRFKKGQSALSNESKARLKKLIASARKIGQINEIHAYAWSDEEYPGEQAKKLPPKSHNLAVARGSAIQNYFASVDGDLGKKVEVITMTERPEGLSEKLKLGDTHEKELFADTGVSTTDKKTTADPKASRAAVMVILKR
jgi:SpoVK/Ycf46/Vps4 family AAA+-type ATPase